jgi:hypothetical protein
MMFPFLLIQPIRRSVVTDLPDVQGVRVVDRNIDELSRHTSRSAIFKWTPSLSEEEELLSYLEAFYGDWMATEDCQAISKFLESNAKMENRNVFDYFIDFISNIFQHTPDTEKSSQELSRMRLQ